MVPRPSNQVRALKYPNAHFIGLVLWMNGVRRGPIIMEIDVPPSVPTRAKFWLSEASLSGSMAAVEYILVV
jgi:hypothetical protein